jgi:hypothetical protein
MKLSQKGRFMNGIENDMTVHHVPQQCQQFTAETIVQESGSSPWKNAITCNFSKDQSQKFKMETQIQQCQVELEEGSLRRDDQNADVRRGLHEPALGRGI